MKYRISFALGSLAVLIGLAVAFSGLGTSQPSAPALAAAAVPRPELRFSFPRGTTEVYRLSWEREDQTALPLAAQVAPAQTGERARFAALLEAELTLSSLGDTADRVLVGISFAHFTAARAEVLGQVVIDGPASAEAQMSGQMAYLEVDRRGRAHVIRFAPGATDLFRHLTTSIAAELDVELPDGAAAWSSVGPGSFGDAQVSFTWEEGWLRRERSSYVGLTTRQLSSRADLEVETHGRLRTLSAEEEALLADAGGQPRSGKVSTELRWLRSGTFTPSPEALQASRDAPAQPVGAVTPSGSADAKLLEQRVAGLSPEQFRRDLLTLSRLGSLPDQSRWLWRATGLLRLDPALAEAIPALFEQREFSARGRALALDVLAFAGTDAAQHALATVLERPEIDRDSDLYADYLQRFAAVQRPSAESIGVVQAAYQRPGRRGLAATYALGAVAHALAASGQPAPAASIVAQLASGLAAAREENARVGHIAALGNTGLESAVAHTLDYLDDASPRVRASVARALRKTQTDVARGSLHDLSGDRDPYVQRAALNTLNEFSVGAQDLDRIATKLRSGALARENDSELLRLAERLPNTPAAVEILQRIVERNPDDAELRARARRLLALR